MREDFNVQRNWCLLSLLLCVEFLVYVWLHTEASGAYGEYVAVERQKYPNEFLLIFLGNLKSSLAMILMGTIPMGIGTLFCTYMTFEGLVASIKWLLPMAGGRNLLLSVLPHGLFEIPAILLSVLLSLLWTRAVTVASINLLRRNPVLGQLRQDLSFQLKSIAFVLLPLTLTGALIEETISGWLVDVLLG